MKKIKIALKNSVVLLLLLTAFIACDKDFANIESDIVNSGTATHFDTDHVTHDVITYNKALDPVQTNNLPVNLLGVYKDPLYGLTTANFVSQLNLPLIDPVFGTNVELDSVILTIPYYSRSTGTNAEGNNTYELDSIFGSEFINLSIYESDYFLRNFDPNSEFDTAQRYFSNAATSSTDVISTSQLEGTLIHVEPDLFKPSPNPIGLRDADNELTSTIAPAMRLKLDTAYWQQKIFDQEGESVLSNQNNFNDYFRGIYFKTEAVGGDGSMMLLNFASSAANITLYYTKDPFTPGDDRDATSLQLSFSGNRVNFLYNEFNFPLLDGDDILGDEKLYLKGGEGSIAVVNLFNGDDEGNSPALEELKTNNWLINEANLVFYVDQDMVNGEEPERIYLYDLENETPLVDYYLDLGNSNSPVNSRINHLGRLERVDDDPEGEGVRYKIRITEHINNILTKDSTNVKLGLAVSGNVNLESNTLQYSLLTDEDTYNKVPGSSIISPRGTVLYGNNTLNEDKKVYLEIFYTEPNN